MASQSLDALSPGQRRRVGLGLAGLGLAGIWLIDAHPEALRVPAWVAYSTVSCFVLAGIAVFLHPWVPRHVYAWLMAALLGAMAIVPAWVALGSGARQCASTTLPLGELGCRIVFGMGAVVLIAAVVLAVSLARRATRAR